MNFIQRGLLRLIGNSKTVAVNIPETEVLANGQLIDKRDIEDPTGKFHSTRYVPTVQNITKVRKNVEFVKPEYDLPTIANAIQMDGILQRSVNIFTEQILKNGYEFVSKNERVQKHINRRIKEIQNLTGNPLYELMNSVARQLVTYGNAYVIKVRSSTKSQFGKSYQLYNREYDPIVGLFVADATTIQVGINDMGQIVNYKQSIGGAESYWDERDIIHIAYNRIPGTLTGMSSIIPILDDVRALRKLEEEIEILGFQYSIPLYLYKVGNKDTPPAPGEIDQAMSTVNNMPAYGMLVVPGHHTIEVPTNNNTPVDLLSFVQHFKTRIFAGLGVSPVAMGEVATSNRNTSEVMDTSMQTITKRYQQLIKHRFEIDLFREILMDGKYDPTIDELEFTFPEIDLEAQIKKETNIVAKWQNNIITREEARLELDHERVIKDPDTFLRLVDIPKIEAQQKGAIQIAEMNAQNAVKLAKLKPAPSAGGGSNSAGVGAGAAPALPKPTAGGHSVTKLTHKVTAPPKAQKLTSNKVAPANQHGKSSGRPKYVKNSIDALIYDSEDKVNVLLQDDGYKSALNITRLTDRLTESTQDTLKDYINSEITSLCDYYHIPIVTNEDNTITNYINSVTGIIKDKINRSAKMLDDNIKVTVFNNELRDFLSLQQLKADNIARLLVYKSLGFVTILIDADECQQHTDLYMPLTDLTYQRIPPFKYSCKCNISEKSINEFNEIYTEPDLSEDQGDTL